MAKSIWDQLKDGQVEDGTVRVKLDGVTNDGETYLLTGNYTTTRSGMMRAQMVSERTGLLKWATWFEVV